MWVRFPPRAQYQNMFEKIENKEDVGLPTKLNKFKDLFTYINKNNLSQDHIDAYDYTVGFAKDLVETKSKSTWDKDVLQKELISKYPNLNEDFIFTLVKCIENYNPPVVLPIEPLW